MTGRNFIQKHPFFLGYPAYYQATPEGHSSPCPASLREVIEDVFPLSVRFENVV